MIKRIYSLLNHFRYLIKHKTPLSAKVFYISMTNYALKIIASENEKLIHYDTVKIS
jgi:hypothetical protein